MRKGLAPIFVIFIVALLAGGAGYYFVVRPTLPQSPACTQEAKQCPDGSYVGRTGPNCEFQACPSTSSGQSAVPVDWKTYTNAQYGFEMKYPGDWKSAPDQASSVSLYREPGVYKDYISISWYDNPQKTSVDQWVRLNRGDTVVSSDFEPIIINGFGGIRLRESGLVGYIGIYFGNNQKIIHISIPDNSKYLLLSGDPLPLFDQILSTFKFTK